MQPYAWVIPNLISNSETFLRISSVSLGKCKYFSPNIMLIVSHTECMCFLAVHWWIPKVLLSFTENQCLYDNIVLLLVVLPYSGPYDFGILDVEQGSDAARQLVHRNTPWTCKNFSSDTILAHLLLSYFTTIGLCVHLSPKRSWPFDEHDELEDVFSSYASNSFWMTGTWSKTGFVWFPSSCRLSPSQKVENWAPSKS